MDSASKKPQQESWHQLIKSFDPTTIIISKIESGYSGKRPSVRALVINVKKAIHHGD